MVHLAHVAGLDDQADLRAGLLPDEVVVDGRGEEQRPDRRQLGVGVPVAEQDDARTVGDGLADLRAQPVERRAERLVAAGATS